ncbi:hypothetical protein BJV78DRAFT_1226593 [Lactifluus subvellereus]|nr:hypothetical protein BJV78DRAFT_1226593 [Lactifluus subvellereus]
MVLFMQDRSRARLGAFTVLATTTLHQTQTVSQSIAMSQPSPAIRVGGRRLSLPTRPRTNTQVDETVAASPGQPADYPRPAAPGAEPNVEHGRGDEEAPPKKERRRSYGAHENERRLRENPQRRADGSWQCREQSGTSRINARISQPGGKVAI